MTTSQNPLKTPRKTVNKRVPATPSPNPAPKPSVETVPQPSRAAAKALAEQRRQARELLAELERRDKIAADLTEWCRYALAPLGQTPARHHLLILNELECLARGRCLDDRPIDRLMINMPPGSAKSTYASVLFPAWYIATHPNSNVLAVSYGSELAEDFSSRVRNLITEYAPQLGIDLVKGSNSVGQWKTTNGCVYRAVGAGGAVTGFRADLLICDDIVKGRHEANSESSRDTLWNWWQSDLLTRLKPRGRIVQIATRWHLDDISGRLLEAEPDQWRIVKLPAIAEDDNDPLGRAPGEALWPEYEPIDQLERKRATMGAQVWSALFQQRPVPAGGSIFRPSAIDIIDIPNLRGAQIVRGYDLAATSKGDWTASVKLARLQDGSYLIVDVTRMRGSPDQVEQHLLANAQMDGTTIKISLPRDAGQAGIYQSQALTRLLAGYNVVSSPESGSKEARASIVAAQVNAGNVRMLRAEWNRAFLQELGEFPSGKYDDMVDALSRAFSNLIVPLRVLSTRSIRHMGR